MNALLLAMGPLLATASSPAASTPTAPGKPALIVVEDRGGVSALPYYQALQLQPAQAPASTPQPQAPTRRFSEADMLPVRSLQLTPGSVEHRTIERPGLRPLFLIGDDDLSRTWLQQRLSVLRSLGAAGLVVNVASPAALQSLRKLAPGLTLSPTSADDLAERLGLRHYPALITATGIEQ